VLYDYALLAAFTAIDRHGVESVLRYFSLFAERQDPEANFREAFGETEAAFEAHVRHGIWPARGSARPAP
jgi:hypothetical protein